MSNSALSTNFISYWTFNFFTPVAIKGLIAAPNMPEISNRTQHFLAVSDIPSGPSLTLSQSKAMSHGFACASTPCRFFIRRLGEIVKHIQETHPEQITLLATCPVVTMFRPCLTLICDRCTIIDNSRSQSHLGPGLKGLIRYFFDYHKQDYLYPTWDQILFLARNDVPAHTLAQHKGRQSTPTGHKPTLPDKQPTLTGHLSRSTGHQSRFSDHQSKSTGHQLALTGHQSTYTEP